MHVLMVCALEVWALPSGGGAPTLYRTLRAYSERGDRVTFVAPTIGANAHLQHGSLRETRPSEPPELPGLTFERFHLPSLQEARLPLPAPIERLDQKLRFAAIFPRLAAARAERILQRERVDVLYGYEVHGALAVERLRRHRLPVVTRFQGTVLKPSLGSTLGRLRRYEEVAAIRVPADLCIMTDDGTQGDEVVAQLNPANVPRLRFWRNGLDLDRLYPVDAERKPELRDALGLPRDALVLLTASRLAAWKRVDRAIAALPGVLETVPNALLVAVGDGEERESLKRQACELGVEQRVRFDGAVAQERVVEYMRASDVLLALADLSNVGNPLLEAMACGLAIVTLDAGDTKELIHDGETGILLRSPDVGSVAAAIVSLADGATRERLGAGAHAYATLHFWTWDDRLRAEVDEVEQLADTKQSRQVSDVAS
jgi:glycosyltransferase involved in cell wall biosynthesis